MPQKPWIQETLNSRNPKFQKPYISETLSETPVIGSANSPSMSVSMTTMALRPRPLIAPNTR